MLLESDPQLVQRLGRDPAGFVEIVRRIDLGSEFSCRSPHVSWSDSLRRAVVVAVSSFDNVNLEADLLRSLWSANLRFHSDRQN